eukprot:Blabericola_migrator_1__3263@NODE_195_length_11539_cov_221_635547_g168_i0_p7_GENE_NODE_195_length_11539_cov_221_635547_g168_i0NODE_195_length_11539_cov_221_635547_g168_i0_p7_ORF_typecomplete_len137_score41_59DUF4628/PF15429_6/0_0026Comm/PF15957_5/0_011Comm/PF15957_5/4_2e02TMEM247/PF15444_6/4_7_NODE_195_length_11539_cov_221_635547_g168_i047755185
MPDSDSSDGGGLYDLVAALKGKPKANKKSGETGEAIEETDKEPKETKEIPKRLKSGLPTYKEALNVAELTHKEQHEAYQREQQTKKRRAEALAAKGSVKETNKRTIYELPEITWHVPMTSFDYLKEVEEKQKRVKK